MSKKVEVKADDCQSLRSYFMCSRICRFHFFLSLSLSLFLAMSDFMFDIDIKTKKLRSCTTTNMIKAKFD